MRWKNIIEEGIGRYKPMFASIYPQGKIPPEVITEMNRVETVLKRMDRVTWGMRWLRFGIVGFENEPDDPAMMADYEKRMRKAIQDVVSKGANIDIEKVRDEYDNFRELIRQGSFEHWFSLPVRNILDFQFDRQMPSFIEREFGYFEDKWIEETEENTVRQLPSDEKIIDFGKGWCWFNLHRSSCRDEGKAMGHCGNGAGNYGETVLSLREHIYENRWKPYLTFILDSNGFLGEMKGRGNEKPAERYHPYIKALLRHPLINGIKGGGYLPENNFALDDLDDDAFVETLKEEKWGFNTIAELLEKGNDDGAITLTENVLKTNNYSYFFIDKEEKWICFDKEPSIEAYVKHNVSGYISAFAVIGKYLSDIDPIKGEDIAQSFYQDYFEDIFIKHAYDFMPFSSSDMEFKFVDGQVRVGMSMYDFSYASSGDEYNEHYVDPDNIMDTYEASFEPYDYIDDIDEAFCDAWKNDKKLREAAETIYEHYEDVAQFKRGSRTVNDPNQLSFDFDKKMDFGVDPNEDWR